MPAHSLLIVGCGDVGRRVLRLLAPRQRVLALTSSPARCPALRALGAVPLVADLDDRATLGRIGGLADAVLHLAPPAARPDDAAAAPGAQAQHRDSPWHDQRTHALIDALARGGRVRTLVYGSTTGVYGDAAGALFDETRPVAPASARALRRVDAEAQLRAWGRRSGVRVSILRIPGIYAPGRPGGDPRERLLRGSPVLVPADDVFTNHIHADDLARACVAALFRGRAQRVVHASDDSDLKMGDYFDLAADLYGLPRPPRISRADAQQQMSPLRLSFVSESRRLRNDRLKRELRLRLHYPSVREGLA